MSYQATAINVMIATPSDMEKERMIIREIIHEWNAVNAKDTQLVLMPIGWETHSVPSMGSRPQNNKQANTWRLRFAYSGFLDPAWH